MSDSHKNLEAHHVEHRNQASERFMLDEFYEHFKNNPKFFPALKPEVAKLVRNVNASAFFERCTEEELNKIPTPILRNLVKHNARVELVQSYSDLLPVEQRADKPRGYNGKATMNDIPAATICSEISCKIGIAENKNDLSVYTAAHEVGHIVDFTSPSTHIDHHKVHLGSIEITFWPDSQNKTQHFSDGDEFTSAYEKDVQKMDQKTKEYLQYYLQPGSAGREETFAELFAYKINKSTTQGIERFFSHTAAVVATEVDRQTRH